MAKPDTFFNAELHNQAEKNWLIYQGLGAAGFTGIILAQSKAEATVPVEVQQVVTDSQDTAGALTGVCLAVFAAGLAPWAAYTTLHWLGRIMKGAI